MISDIIGSVVTGVFSGGATGLIGIGIKAFEEASKRRGDLEILRETNRQAQVLRQMDIEAQVKLSGITAESQERLADIAAEQRATEAASTDYQASIGADRATYLAAGAQEQSRAARVLMALVDFARGIIRPGAAIYSMVLLSILVAWVQDLYRTHALTLTPDQTQRLAMEVIGTATYLVTTCVTWYFGVRPAARK